MKQQQMNVYARFIAEDTPAEPMRSDAGKARRTGNRATSTGVRSPKQGLKKQPGLPK